MSAGIREIFDSNPLVRLVVPFAGGIAFGWCCNVEMLHICSFLALFAATLLLSFFDLAPKWKPLFGVGAFGVMLSLGLLSEHLQHDGKAVSWGGGKREYTARLVETPLMRGTNVKVLAELSSPDSVPLPGVRTEGLVYLYFTPTVESELLQVGDVLAVETTVSPPENRGNPAEFDVEKFYYVKGVSGTAFVPENNWRVVERGRHDVFTLSLCVRERLIKLYERLGFDGGELAMLSALTLGEKRDFPKALKEEYATAGASHVLALSGLHLGIFYMLLSFLLPYRGRARALVLLRELVIVAVLWAFAFVAGLSPSVVRAAILFTLMSLARCLGRDASSLSSLSLAALIMLVYDPHLLFDVSFQLSFAAVSAILLFVEPVKRFLKIDKCGRVVGYVAGMLLVSVVAQVGTLPLVWYHFGVFPLYFMLTNLVVVPLAFVVMSLAVLLWAASPVSFLSHAISWLLHGVVAFMNNTVMAVAALPGASFALPSLGVVELSLLLSAAALVVCSLALRRWRMLLCSSVVAALLAVLYCFAGGEEKPGSYMLIYNNRKNPLLHIVEGKANWLLSTVPELDAEYEYSSAPYVKRERLDAPCWVTDGCENSLLSFDDGLLSYAGFKVRLVDNAHWRENIYSEPADMVILCRGFLGSIKELLDVYPTGCLVMDASLYERSRRRIMRECAALDVDVVDVASAGALMFIPGGESFELVNMRGK